jgi:hypothetical protein
MEITINIYIVIGVILAMGYLYWHMRNMVKVQIEQHLTLISCAASLDAHLRMIDKLNRKQEMLEDKNEIMFEWMNEQDNEKFKH